MSPIHFHPSLDNWAEMAIYNEDTDYRVSHALAKGHRKGERRWLAVFGADCDPVD